MIRNLMMGLLNSLYSYYWAATTVLGLGRRYLATGSRLYSNKLHILPPRLLSDFNHADAVLPSGIRLHYVEEGARDAPLMLLVHGFPEFWYSWRFQLKQFSDKFRVVAIDQRGYGESDKPEGVENYDVKLLATDVKQFIRTLGYQKAVVVGHDWGGAVVWRAALMYPDVIDKLIILNCPHPGAFKHLLKTDSKQFKNSWYIFMFQLPRLPELVVAAEDFKMMEEMLRGRKGGIKNRDNFTDEDMEAWKYTFSRPGALTSPINYYRRSFSSGVRSSMKDIVQPETLIIWGEEDAFLVREGATLSVSACRSARCVFIPNASHWVQQDEPEAVNNKMRDFLTNDHSDGREGTDQFDRMKSHL